MDVKYKRLRRTLATLRGGTTTLLRIETGRWNGLKRELGEDLHRQCTLVETEDMDFAKV